MNLSVEDTYPGKDYKKLPLTLKDAVACAKNSTFIRDILGDNYLDLIPTL